jgi:glycosyltransferase involved in cell wall biosynthesis
MDPTVSVIIPYYNGSAYIDEAVRSVWAQTHPVSQLIIVENGSRPEEGEYLRRYEDRAIIVHQAINVGPSMGRNLGIAHATGDWLAFLDCDDVWLPNKLEQQLAYVRQNPECRAVHTAIRAVTVEGRELGVFEKTKAGPEDFLLYDWCPVLPSSLLVERKAFVACGLFNPTMPSCEDLECFLRLSSYFPIHAVNEPLTVRRVRPNGLSRDVAGWLDGQNRTIRFYRRLYPSEGAFRRRLLEMNTSIISQLFYRRPRRFWSTLFRATEHDLPLARLGPRVVGTLVRNRLKRAFGGADGKPDADRASDADESSDADRASVQPAEAPDPQTPR